MEPKANITQSIRDFSKGRKYFSFDEVKKFIGEKYPNVAENTIKTSLKRLKQSNEIFDAGRGYYSTIENTVELSAEPVKELKKIISNNFPFLKFYLWSTEQIKFSFHHLFTKNIYFVHSEKDALQSIGDSLKENKYSVFVNPTQKTEIEKYVSFDKDTVILRPSYTKVKTIDHIPLIENILVDLYLESGRLNIIDGSEYDRILVYFLSQYRLNISYLLRYAENRKVRTKLKNKLELYTNAAL